MNSGILINYQHIGRPYLLSKENQFESLRQAYFFPRITLSSLWELSKKCTSMLSTRLKSFSSLHHSFFPN